MRVLACIGLLALCLGLAGCRLFGRKSPTAKGTDHPPAAAGGETASTPVAPLTPVAPERTASGSATDFDGLLAGRVVDNYSSRSPAAAIQVVALQEKDAPAAPIEVSTDAQGYFTIPGLSPGQHYKLVVRARDGDRLLAGIVYATPPDPKLVIRISEDYASSNTPPPPPPPTWPGSKSPATPDAKATPKQPAATLDRPWNPRTGGSPDADPAAPRGPAGLGTPTPKDGAASNQAPPGGPVRPQDIVEGADSLARAPTANVPNPERFNPATAPVQSAAPSRQPFCVLTNNRLENLGLPDLNGQFWEFRQKHHGQLILLDFWGTWCGPCCQAVPELIEIQQRYGSSGLDIIGIDYEHEGTPQQQSQKVKAFRDRMGVNYQLLLGGDMRYCPVKNQFRIEAFPTLFLLDAQGNILWHSEGLDQGKRLELEGEIRWHLRLR